MGGYGSGNPQYLKPHPNMNIGNERKPGATTELGKLRQIASRTKQTNVIELPNGMLKLNPKRRNRNTKLNRIDKLFVKHGFNPKDPRVLKYIDSYELWMKTYSLKELQEDILLKAITHDMLHEHAIRLLDRVESGKPMTDGERENVKLIKDLTVEAHKMKYGSKFVFEKKIGISDIRKALFEHLKEKEKKESIDAEVINGEDNVSDSGRELEGQGNSGKANTEEV